MKGKPYGQSKRKTPWEFYGRNHIARKDLQHISKMKWTRLVQTIAMLFADRYQTSHRRHTMPKFYVQSGRLEMVLQARDSRCAAIWAAHRTLGQTLPFLCENESDYAVLADVTQLGATIRVSQRGFDREDAAIFDTLDIVTEWNQLLVALDRLTASSECEMQSE